MPDGCTLTVNKQKTIMTFDDNSRLSGPAASVPAPSSTENKSTRSTYKFTLICKSKCKAFALEMAKQHRPANKFGRCGEDFLVACEGALRNFIASRVKSHPSKGKTLK